MKYIWNQMENKKWKAETKAKAFQWISVILFGIIGLLLWGIVQIWTLKTLDWMFCFIGYAMVISWLSAIIYTFNYDFHDGII